ncbi:MAG: energy transducer TonB [Gemmatimonadota bacterium]|nr:MAG: energy transducer TonB [Gemmatimonadota bacterium]
MKRILWSMLALVVLATAGLYFGRRSKTDDVSESHTPPAGDSDSLYHIVDEMPRQINPLEVQYPKEALDAGIGGTVHIKMILSKEGLVEEAEVSVSCGVTSLDQAALNAARQLKFTPAILDGKPVRMRLYKPFVFDPDNVEKRHPSER